MEGFANQYSHLTVEQLDKVFIDFSFLYIYGDSDIRESDNLIGFEQWIVFSSWEKEHQALALASLIGAIAIKRKA